MPGGYDISQSTSESSTQGLDVNFGAFNNGGGLRIPSWFWAAGLAVAALLAFAWLKRK